MPLATIDPQREDLTIYQGATWRRGALVKAAATSGGPKVPVDLTGYTARLQVRTEWGASTALVTLTDADGLTLGSDGTLWIEFSATRAALLLNAASAAAAGSFVYDLRLVAPVTGEVTVILWGTLTAPPRVTVAA